MSQTTDILCEERRKEGGRKQGRKGANRRLLESAWGSCGETAWKNNKES